MSHKKVTPFIVKVSVLGYFPLLIRGFGQYNTNVYSLQSLTIYNYE